MTTRKKITLKIIADKLGLDISSVSKALNDKSDISEETKKRVQELAEKLGYQPNIFAKGLIQNKSNLIGVIIPDLGLSFYSKVLEGIQSVVEKQGYMPILLLNSDSAKIEKRNLEFLLALQVDGILINPAPGNSNKSLIKNIIDQGIQVVFYDRYIKDIEASCVKIDDTGASEKLTKYLIDRNRRRIAYLGPNAGISVAVDRYQGYRKALDDAGIEFDPKLLINAKVSGIDSKDKLRAVLRNGIKPDGIICMGGLVALGAGEALLEEGYQVPKDCMIAEFGDNDIVSKLGVVFTSVDQFPVKMGKSAAELVIGEIENTKQEIKQVIIPVSLKHYTSLKN